jgi:vancomycin resistance protein YoaR
MKARTIVSETMPADRFDPEPRPQRWPSVLLLLASLLWLVALALVVAVATYQFRYAERIYPGVWVSHVSLGDLTRAEAEAVLESAGIPFPTEEVALRYGDRVWTIRPEDLKVALDVQSAVTRAYQVGRRGSLVEDLQEQALVYRNGRAIDPVFTFHDEGFLAYAVALMAQEVNRPPREATLKVLGLDVLATRGETGLEVDEAATRAALEERFILGGGGEVELVVRVTQPALSDVSEGEKLVKLVIGSPLTLEYEDGEEGQLSVSIDQETLADWMRWRMDIQPDWQPLFTVTLNEAGVRAWVEELATELFLPAQDASFDFDPETGALTPIVPSVWGRELDIEETVQRILAQAVADVRTAALPLIPIKPSVAMEDAPDMGIRELVAQATTEFKASSAARVHNIAQAASRFQGVLIPPGGVFSFNEHLGEVLAETGYEESLIIWGDRTQVGIGGGVCQVSTTAFQAALNGGYPILERYSHGYVVSWYGEPGMDATVYAPRVDFRFRNDSDYYLLIKTETDTQAGTLTFSFYGTESGRMVEIISLPVENVTDPPPPVYTEDPDLPTGTIKQVDWAVKGMDVTVQRIVRQGDDVLSEDVFISRYHPWSAKYRYGPGTTLPPGAVPEEAEVEG